MDHPDGIKIPRTISYSSELGSTIEPLRINNVSNNTYVFKVNKHNKHRYGLIKKLLFLYIQLMDFLDRNLLLKFQSKLFKNLIQLFHLN